MLALARTYKINQLKPILAVHLSDGPTASKKQYEWAYANKSYDLDLLNSRYRTKLYGKRLLREQSHQRHWVWTLDELRALAIEEERKVFVYVFYRWRNLDL